ncbi:MAG: 3-deoxy-D-manno-octulosonic acid transferase [Rickettsiaceae bacterium]|nr:3-deoxy-D-manno-octulosonic acid transferase [Rickettsiaceae bacterium]
MKLIYLYNILTTILLPIYFLLLLYRLAIGKESYRSIMERLTLNNKIRPNGKLLWIHAASVGETTIAITLIENLNKVCPQASFLITTGTLSSADILQKRLTHKNVIHYFIPHDNIIFVSRFLKHWQPDLGIFIESELWPCLLTQGSKRCKMILANAKLSDKSFAFWQKWHKYFNLTGCFVKILTQSESYFAKYSTLNVEYNNQAIIKNLGNIKFANKPLTVNDQKLKLLQNCFKKRKIFTAASTHAEDEAVILPTIKNLKNKKLNYYPVIILRHPHRIVEITSHCQKLGLSYSIRSKDEVPNLANDLYIVDSFGELGLFYQLSFITFVAGSFKKGGHNLLEPAYFNNVILFGPDMSNHQDIADDMLKLQAAIQIHNQEELEQKLQFFLKSTNGKIATNCSKNAADFVSRKQEVITKYLLEIEEFVND